MGHRRLPEWGESGRGWHPTGLPAHPRAGSHAPRPQSAGARERGGACGLPALLPCPFQQAADLPGGVWADTAGYDTQPGRAPTRHFACCAWGDSYGGWAELARVTSSASALGCLCRLGDTGGLVEGRRLDVERIGEPNEEVEQARVVDGLGNLRIRPTGASECPHLLVRHAVGVQGHGGHELEQQALGGGDRCLVETSVAESLGRLGELLALQLQEPGMCAQSIPAATKSRDVRRDHLVLSAGELAIPEVKVVDGAVDRGQKVWPEAHRAQDRRHLTCRMRRTDSGEEVRELPLRLRVLDPVNSWHEVLILPHFRPARTPESLLGTATLLFALAKARQSGGTPVDARMCVAGWTRLIESAGFTLTDVLLRDADQVIIGAAKRQS